MSRIANLIAKHCPNGVEYSEVSNVMEKVRSKGKLPRSKYEESGLIEVIDQGQDLIAAYSSDLSIVNPPAQWILFGDHTRTVKWWEGSFVQGADGLVPLQVKVPGNPKFYYYAMKNLAITNRGYNRHWSVVKDMKLPVPPLEVQDEIVRILDSYTNLEANLQKELAARRTQYEYYRDSLLSLENLTSRLGEGIVRLLPLNDVCARVSSGGTPKRSVPGYFGGSIPWIRSTDLNFKSIGSVEGSLTESGLNTSSAKLIPAGTVLIAMAGATVAKCGITTVEATTNQNCCALEADLKQVNPKFLFHTLCREYKTLMDKAQGTQQFLNMTRIKQHEIPVPPLSEQERIVAILDKFDALVNDLSSGLPAEIEARRKQYEYYRDRLLVFTPSN